MRRLHLLHRDVNDNLRNALHPVGTYLPLLREDALVRPARKVLIPPHDQSFGRGLHRHRRSLIKREGNSGANARQLHQMLL